MMGPSQEIIEARKELEKLKERERQLEARMGNRKIKALSDQNGRGAVSDFEEFYKHETNKHRDSYGEIESVVHIKPKNTSIQEVNERSDTSDEEIDDRRRSRKTNNEAPLIDWSDDDDDAEVLQVFESDRQSSRRENYHDIKHSNEVPNGNEAQHHDGREAGGDLEELQLLSDSSMEQNLGQHIEQYDNIYNGEDEQKLSYEDEDEDGPTDRRRQIQYDIEENQKRERMLRFERGSMEDIDEYDDEGEESDSEEEAYEESEDIREKILREIAEGKMRELELHAKYEEYGLQYTQNEYNEEDQDDGVHNSFSVDPRDLIAMEIRELQERESELKHINSGAFLEDDESLSGEEQHAFTDPRERIEYEIRAQQEREVELNHMRRTLSNENLLLIDDIEEDEEEIKTEVDTRGRIYREMEELKQREQELRQSDYYRTEYDIINMSREEEKIDNEEDNLDVRDKISREIYDLQTREEELKKQHNCSFIEQPSYDIIVLPEKERKGTEEDGFTARSLKDTDKKKFGSREDLVAYFGTHTEDDEVVQKRKPKPNPNRVKIPEAFISCKHKSQPNRVNVKQNGSPERKEQNGRPERKEQKKLFNNFSYTHHANDNDYSYKERDYVDKKPDDETSQNGRDLLHTEIIVDKQQNELYFHDEMRPRKTSKRMLVRQRKRSVNERKSLVSQDVKKKEEKRVAHNDNEHEKKTKQTTSSSKVWHMHPIAAKWEKKGEEERQRKKTMELERQKQKEERLRFLAEKAEREQHAQLLYEEEQRHKEKRDKEMKLLRLKQQGLNQLWTSKKPVVTVADNPDQNDRYLLQTNKKNEPVKQTSKKTPTKESTSVQSIAVMKKIKRWEKKIAKKTDP